MSSLTHYRFFTKVEVIFSKNYCNLKQLSRIKRNRKHYKPLPMNKVKPALTLALLVVLGVSFRNYSLPEATVVAESVFTFPTEVFSPVEQNGKIRGAELLQEPFTPATWDDLGFPAIDEKLALALQHQLHVLNRGNFRDGQKIGNLRTTASDMEAVIKILLQRAGTQPNDLNQYLEPYQVWGDDRKGNVYFTGYFTPTLKVKKKKDSKYKYPLYAFPENWQGRLPSRREIDAGGALVGKGLELAYAANAFDVYTMHLQGSGVVEFLESGERSLFNYAGENGHPYRNIEWFFRKRPDLSIPSLTINSMGRFLKKNPHLTDSVLFYNPSYVFFTPKKGLIKGAGMVPLMEDISIAADPQHFPLGSVVLAAMPVVKNDKVTHHEYRLLLPQDVGGAIKGPAMWMCTAEKAASARTRPRRFITMANCGFCCPKRTNKWRWCSERIRGVRCFG
jgi:membrane-bound lytic murein transglycosylase A